MGTRLLPRLASILSIVGALVTITLYGVLVFANPYVSAGRSRESLGVATAMTLLALLAIFGSLARRPLPLFEAFVASFLPVGLYMLGTPGIFQGIGFGNLLYLVAGLGLSVPLRVNGR